jgi:hypothetical protein
MTELSPPVQAEQLTFPGSVTGRVVCPPLQGSSDVARRLSRLHSIRPQYVLPSIGLRL